MTVSDVGPTTVNKIMEQCFKEVGLKKRDLNGQTPFGRYALHSSNLLRCHGHDFKIPTSSDLPTKFWR